MCVRGTNIREVLGKIQYNLLKPMTIIGPCFGLYVSEEQSPAASVIAAIVLIINTITSYLYLYFNLGNIGGFVKGITSANIFTCGWMCLALSFIKRKTYVRVLKEVNDEFEAEFANATHSTKRGMIAGNMSLMFFIISMSSAFVGYVMDSLLSEKRILPTPAWFPFDTDNTTGYTIVVITQVCGGLCSGFIISLTVIYFINILEQTCLHFDNLSNSLRLRLEIESKNKEYSVEDKADKSFHEFLVKIIQRHIQLLRRIHAMNDLFSRFFLIYCIILVPIISSAAFEFVSFEEQQTGIFYMKHAFIVISGVSLLHGPCKCGSKIVIVQTDLSRALYSEGCTVYSESIKRTLSIINLRAQVPYIITAGGFISFDMVAYGQALGLYYTIFTMLRHFKTTQ